MTAEEIISDEKIHGNANWGSMEKREVVNLGVLKVAIGFYQGRTSRAIITEDGLIDKTIN